MISVLSTTGKYLLQPSLMEMHHSSLEWLSTTVLWKQEVAFFQKLLDQHSPRATSLDDKKKVSHFQNMITYYGGELIDTLRKKIKIHEHKLADRLKELKTTDSEYYQEHGELMEELGAFMKTFNSFKSDFFTFIDLTL
ncbi:MAG: hypothetical protein HC819_24355 [Cyclobacteriaceae bacterium]|nr:hypothetical protein [Cyclobacteriaceae bacterium]